TRSPGWEESNSNRRRQTGSGCRPPSRTSSSFPRRRTMRLKHWWFTVPLRLKSIFRSRRVEQELDEELRFHLEQKIEEGIAEGLSPEDARYRALRAMGGLEQQKEEMRDMRRVHWLTDFVDDVRYAIRSLSRTPGLTAFVVV